MLVAGAAATTPLPAKPQGAGAEPTAGGGVIGGALVYLGVRSLVDAMCHRAADVVLIGLGFKLALERRS